MKERLQSKDFYPTMRGYFAGCLYNEMWNNSRIVLITCDLGYKMFDRIRDEMSHRFLNVGAAEQAAVGIAVGMALKGKIPFVYSITPFTLYRPYEWLRNYLHHEKIPVKLVGSGRDRDYINNGFTHHCEEARAVLDTLPNIVQFWPETKEEMMLTMKALVNNGKPSFISLRR